MTRSMRGPLRRRIRSFTLGSGPLKRPSDRLQVLGRFLVMLALLAAVPLALPAASITRSHLKSVAAAQNAERHVTRAVVLHDRHNAVPSSSGEPPATVVRTEITWTGAAGRVRHGMQFVAADSPAGTIVRVWVDRRGDLTTAPMDRGTIAASSFTVGLLVTVVVPLVAWLLHLLLCAVLNAHRGRQWAQDWARVERVWRTRLS
jgi:hypothetical protein